MLMDTYAIVKIVLQRRPSKNNYLVIAIITTIIVYY